MKGELLLSKVYDNICPFIQFRINRNFSPIGRQYAQ